MSKSTRPRNGKRNLRESWWGIPVRVLGVIFFRDTAVARTHEIMIKEDDVGAYYLRYAPFSASDKLVARRSAPSVKAEIRFLSPPTRT